MQPKESQNAGKMHSKCSQNSAKIQSKCSQNAAKIQSKCSQKSINNISKRLVFDVSDFYVIKVTQFCG